MPRYKLRTLLILITIIAAFFGGRASLLPTVREQGKRIDDLKKEVAERRSAGADRQGNFSFFFGITR
jgi:hypothetical protein